MAVAAGVDALGLVSDMPSGPGVISNAEVREIADWVPPPVASFLLTSRERGVDIAVQAAECQPSVVQIVRHIDPAEHARLTEHLPAAVRRVQVIHVEDDAALELVDVYAPLVHALLLDSGRPGAGALGGTGRTHDWEVSAEIVRRSPCPVFLAGGLTPENAGDAVREVRPFGLDLCSGVRTDGDLDGRKLADFMRAVRLADFRDT